MAYSVNVGETWSVLSTHSRKRVEFIVERIAKEGTDELRAFGTLVGGGKTVSFTVRAMSKGLRGARLVRHADGHEPYKPPPDKAPRTAEYTATASDYRKTKAPKGMATAPPRMMEAFAMREKSVPVPEIAAHFGVTVSTVSSWLSRVREKRDDEKMLAMLNGRST
jgi:hypothetical protein